MQLRNLKKVFKILVFSLLLSGLAATAHATTLTPSSGAISPAANQFQSYTSATTLTARFGLFLGNYTWWSSNLPAGLTMTISGRNNRTCTITGVPTVSGTNLAFSVTVRDPFGLSATGNYTITINPRCQFSGGSSGSILFDINPTLAGPIYDTITQNVSFQCGPSTTYSYTIAPSQPKLTGAKNTSGIPFILSAGQGLAAIGLNATDATLISLLTTSAQVFVADYQNAYAETDTSGAITVTINWTGAAAGSMNATVNATGIVQNVCSVTGSPVLNFGNLDAATNAGGATATVTPPSIICTMGDVITVTNNGGLNYSGTPRMKSGTNYVNYNFNSASSMAGAGRTTNIGGSGTGYLNMGATISAGALDNVPAGAYSDTVTLTISY